MLFKWEWIEVVHLRTKVSKVCALTINTNAIEHAYDYKTKTQFLLGLIIR